MGNGGRDRDRTCDPYDVSAKLRLFLGLSHQAASRAAADGLAAG
jgi:hypothetical protein